MKINKYHPMGDIYLFKMLVLLIKMHIYVLNQKSKGKKKIFNANDAKSFISRKAR